MRTVTGKIVDGKVVLDEDVAEFLEGEEVTLILPESEEQRFEVNPELKAALLEAMAQVDRGEFVTAEQFLQSLSGDE